MGFDTTNNQWNQEQLSLSNTALSSSAEDGTGGGRMEIHDAGRTERLRTLVQATYVNASNYPLAAGVVDSESTQWNERFEQGERDHSSLSTGAEQGENSKDVGDMDVFALSRENRLRRLVQADYVNLSDYDLTAGFIDSESTQWNHRFESGEVENTSTSVSVENGEGGDDMSVWTASDQAKLRRLVQEDYVNSSIYSIPHGIVDSESTQWNERFETGSVEHSSQEAEVESGVGGGEMRVFSLDRTTQLRNLAGTDYNNKSQYGLPSGVVDTASTDWNRRFEGQEQGHGFLISGSFATASATPMPGVAKLFQDNKVVTEKDISGAFIVTGPPQSGVVSGEDTDDSTNSFRFEPDIDAIEYTIDSLNVEQDIGRIQYGEATGIVRDYNGDPVAGEPVAGPGVASKTNANGEYSLQGPGGTSVTLRSLNDAYEKDVLLTGGQTEQIDWQFAGVRGTIKLPSGISIEGTTVTTTRDTPTLETDQDGRALFTEFPPNVAATMTFGGAISVDFTSNGEGQLTSKTVRVGAGFQGKCINAVDKEPILDVDVQIDGAETTFKSFSTSTGRFFVGTNDTGNLTLVMAKADKRFEEYTLSAELLDGDVKEQDIELQPKTVTGSFG